MDRPLGSAIGQGKGKLQLCAVEPYLFGVLLSHLRGVSLL